MKVGARLAENSETAESERAGRRALAIARSLGETDTLLVLLSGVAYMRGHRPGSCRAGSTRWLPATTSSLLY